MPDRPATPGPLAGTGQPRHPAGAAPGAALLAAFAGADARALPAVGHAGHAGAGPPVRAWLFELAQWRPWLPAAAALLDQAERARVARRHRAGDRDDLTLAYALHRLALGRVLGCEPWAVALGRDGAGRPWVAGTTLQTSLSHAEGCVAVAVSHAGAVGVDVEPASRMAAMAEIAGQVLHPDEAAALAGLDARLRPAELLRTWVRKEALLKAAGIGLAREMPGFVAPAGRPVALPLEAGGVAADEVVLHMLAAGDAWCAAIACPPRAAVASAWLVPPP